MEMIDRAVVVIKRKRPFLDWVNRDPTLSPALSMEELKHDCTAILVPELGSNEATLEYLEPLKPLLFEAELEEWNRDPTTWPAERTAELFDAWFDLEVHSMVWDIVDAPIDKEGSQAMDLSGTWIVVSSPDFDHDYLHLETTPYITLDQEGTEVSGDFQIGLIAGSLSGHWEGNQVLFSFEGADEMDPVNGTGTLGLQGEQMIFRLLFHFGDEFTFQCESENRPDRFP